MAGGALGLGRQECQVNRTPSLPLRKRLRVEEQWRGRKGETEGQKQLSLNGVPSSVAPFPRVFPERSPRLNLFVFRLALRRISLFSGGGETAAWLFAQGKSLQNTARFNWRRSGPSFCRFGSAGRVSSPRRSVSEDRKGPLCNARML